MSPNNFIATLNMLPESNGQMRYNARLILIDLYSQTYTFTYRLSLRTN